MKTEAMNIWTFVIAGIGLIFLAVTFWSVNMARKNVSDVTDARYYAHGLRYNDTQIEREAARTLGWSTEVQLRDRVLQIEARDRDGQLISGARATISLQGTVLPAMPLKETAPGIYSHQIDDAARGQLSFRFELQQQGARFSQSILVMR